MKLRKLVFRVKGLVLKPGYAEERVLSMIISAILTEFYSSTHFVGMYAFALISKGSRIMKNLKLCLMKRERDSWILSMLILRLEDIKAKYCVEIYLCIFISQIGTCSEVLTWESLGCIYNCTHNSG